MLATCPSCGMKFTAKPSSRPQLSEADLRRRWLDDYSPNVRKDYDATLTHFCEINGTDTVKVLQEDKEVIEEFLSKYYTHRKDVEGIVPTTLSKADAKELSIGKSTLHYLRINARRRQSFKISAKIERKLAFS